MRVTVKEPQEIQIYSLDEYTVDGFCSKNNMLDGLSWCNGYLFGFTHVDRQTFDDNLKKGIRLFDTVEYAPMPYFQKEYQTRYSKVAIFDKSESPVMQAIVEYIKGLKETPIYETRQAPEKKRPNITRVSGDLKKSYLAEKVH